MVCRLWSSAGTLRSKVQRFWTFVGTLWSAVGPLEGIVGPPGGVPQPADRRLSRNCRVIAARSPQMGGGGFAGLGRSYQRPCKGLRTGRTRVQTGRGPATSVARPGPTGARGSGARRSDSPTSCRPTRLGVCEEPTSATGRMAPGSVRVYVVDGRVGWGVQPGSARKGASKAERKRRTTSAVPERERRQAPATCGVAEGATAAKSPDRNTLNRGRWVDGARR